MQSLHPSLLAAYVDAQGGRARRATRGPVAPTVRHVPRPPRW